MHRAGTDVRCPACGVTVAVPNEAQGDIPPAVNLHGAAAASGRLASGVRPPPLPLSPERRIATDAPAQESSGFTSAPSVAARRGYQPDAHRRFTSYLVAVGLVAISSLGLVPSVWAIAAHWAAEHSPGMPNWALAVLLISGLQLVFAFYLASVPDWSTAWMATAVALAGSAIYSLVLSLALMGSGATHLVQLLQLSDEVRSSGAARWCGLMLCASMAVTYFSGAFALRWHRAYKMLAELV